MNYDIYKEKCPSRLVLNIISSKWVILIIEKLAVKTYRFEEIKREIEGISAKVLTEKLKLLEGHGLIIRTDYSTELLHVVYSLSPLGESFSIVCKNITDWSKSHISEFKSIGDGST